VTRPGGETQLRATVESQIIPRLAFLLRDGHVPELTPPSHIDARGLRHLAELATAGDVDALWIGMRRLEDRGGSDVASLLELVTAVARLVGKDWEEDRRSWLEVTIAGATLQQLICVLGRERRCAIEQRGAVVLFAAPGEQHTLSIQLLGEVLRRMGWRTRVEPRLTVEGVIEIVSNEPTQMVGMTVSSEDRMVLSRRDVMRIRAASIDPGLIFAVGGAIDVMQYASDIGAAHCADARDAVALLETPRRLSGPPAVGSGHQALHAQPLDFPRGFGLSG
jgi:methanogenic corrinoid protein MtbC1